MAENRTSQTEQEKGTGEKIINVSTTVVSSPLPGDYQTVQNCRMSQSKMSFLESIKLVYNNRDVSISSYSQIEGGGQLGMTDN